MKMKKTYAKLLIFMAMAAALIGCPPTEEAVKISFSANGGSLTERVMSLTVGTKRPTDREKPMRTKGKSPYPLR